MTIHDYIIRGTDGVTYTVIVYNSTHALLSFETKSGTNFLVAEELTKEENGAYTCKSARNFGEDVSKAVQHIEQSGPKRRGINDDFFLACTGSGATDCNGPKGPLQS